MARVLIVDDRDDVRMALAMLMEDEGHAVLEGVDGGQVVPLTLQHKPDLILLDLMMPVVDGYEALRRLKGDASLRHVPVVVVSAKPSPEDRKLALELGAIDYVAKPWSVDDLVGRVNRALNGSASKTGK
ncbi:MAG: response regulator [Chloroflexi bacterium]|nr:response regulator [Chloroflexota bacterium]